jgi:uncharacterized membrane protein YjfL (UPF0719 family)
MTHPLVTEDQRQNSTACKAPEPGKFIGLAPALDSALMSSKSIFQLDAPVW